MPVNFPNIPADNIHRAPDTPVGVLPLPSTPPYREKSVPAGGRSTLDPATADQSGSPGAPSPALPADGTPPAIPADGGTHSQPPRAVFPRTSPAGRNIPGAAPKAVPAATRAKAPHAIVAKSRPLSFPSMRRPLSSIRHRMEKGFHIIWKGAFDLCR